MFIIKKELSKIYFLKEKQLLMVFFFLFLHFLHYEFSLFHLDFLLDTDWSNQQNQENFQGVFVPRENSWNEELKNNQQDAGTDKYGFADAFFAKNLYQAENQ